MKCLSYLHSFLPVGVRPQWGVFLKACLVRLPMLVSRSMKWKWRGNAETTSSRWSSRSHLIKGQVELLLVLLVGCLLLLGCSRSHSSPALQQSSQAYRSSAQQILPGKEKRVFIRAYQFSSRASPFGRYNGTYCSLRSNSSFTINYRILFLPQEEDDDRSSSNIRYVGTLATFGLSTLDSLFGCIAGIITIAYMSYKFYQEVIKK